MAVHADRIRKHTSPRAQRRIEEKTFAKLTNYADGSPGKVSRRLEQLDREWDTDRLLEIEAAGTGLLGLALSIPLGARMLLLPATVAGAVLLQAISGRYPLMPVFRRLGIRTAREIARERYALKVLRRDFATNAADDVVRQATAVFEEPGETAESAPAGANGEHVVHLPPTARRVELQTSAEINEAIRKRSNATVEQFSHESVAEINRRLDQLENEWDIERVLQANASILSLLGIGLGARADRRFLILPAAVFGFFAQHALQGWCPPIPVFRRLGVRTRHEIERERHALKALRGDFEGVAAAGEMPATERVQAILAAVDA